MSNDLDDLGYLYGSQTMPSALITPTIVGRRPHHERGRSSKNIGITGDEWGFIKDYLGI